MGVRLKRRSNTAAVENDPIVYDTSLTQRETTVDGYTFHWGINEVRNFMDDGVGAAHAAFSTAAHDTVVEDNLPFNNSRS